MVFKVFDVNGDGQICFFEFGVVFWFFGGDVMEQELQLIMNDVDKNQDGFISLEEFKDVYIVKRNVGDLGFFVEDLICEVFVMFDKDGNNFICVDEL